MELCSRNASLVLAAEIEDQMSFMAFFVADLPESSPGRQVRLLTADGLPLPPARIQKKKMSVAKACVTWCLNFYVLFHPNWGKIPDVTIFFQMA